MGVDYSANYGMGVKLVEPDFDELDLGNVDWEIDSMGEYCEHLEDEAKSQGIEVDYFETGQENYGGNPNEYYLCIKDPMSDGVNGLKKKIEIFKGYLKTNKIEHHGEVDLVGGLNVY